MTDARTVAEVQAELRETRNALNETESAVDGLSNRLERIRREERIRSIVAAIAIVIYGVLTVVVLSTVDKIDESVQLNRSINRKVEACVAPEGDCYQVGQERTARAVDAVVEAIERTHP